MLRSDFLGGAAMSGKRGAGRGSAKCEELRLYPTRASQCAVDCAVRAMGGRAELLSAEVALERGSGGAYSADARYFYRITARVLLDTGRTAGITALAVARKRVVFRKNGFPGAAGRPLFPPVLRLRLADGPRNPARAETLAGVPSDILARFGYELCFSGAVRRIYAALPD